MVTSACKQAMSLKSHDFIHLDFSNYYTHTPEVIKLYEKGLSLRDIETRMGISKTRVRGLLLKAGVPLRDSLKERGRATQGTRSKKAAKPPYGFCFSEGQIVRHPKEYPHLLAIIGRWKSGQPLNSIATWLNGKKVRSPMGKEWSWNSIANIIQRIKTGQLIEKDGYYELR
ncbi:MAG: hypothetical protein B7Y39_10135 [Bdellovibrio sp. 28-41-41]|nr:MAG: hypothetical protein B7Y39_10135 [Bdellovibrio sp. 28-41-41]